MSLTVRPFRQARPARLIRLIAALCATVPALASAQLVLTASSWVPPSHTLTETQKEWCQLLEQRTAGKAKWPLPSLPR